MTPHLAHPLLRPATWIAGVIVAAIATGEVIGPALLALALGLWALHGLLRPGPLLQSVGCAGILPWLMPLLAVASCLWSQVPLVSLRGGIQLGLTVAMALLIVREVPPRHFIVVTWLVMAVICVLSVAVNNQHYDGMTGRTTMAGIYLNKNSLGVAASLLALTSTALLLDRRQALPLRLLGLAGVPFGLLLGILAYSVGVLVNTVIGIALMLLILPITRLPRHLVRAYANLVLVGGLVGGLLALAGILAFREELLLLLGKDPTLTGRTVVWFYAERIAPDYLPLGIGYQAFWQQGFTPAEFLWKKMHVAARGGFHFHSLYYELLIQLGYAGVLAGAVVVLRYALALLTWLRRAPDMASGFCAAVFLMLVGLQWQSNGLFSQFDPAAFFVTTVACYALRWQRLQQRRGAPAAAATLRPQPA